jgi:hypothetical protein
MTAFKEMEEYSVRGARAVGQERHGPWLVWNNAGVKSRKMIAVEYVIAALPRERQRAIEARGNALLTRVTRRMTMIATFPDQEPVVPATAPSAKEPKAAGKKKARTRAA